MIVNNINKHYKIIAKLQCHNKEEKKVSISISTMKRDLTWIIQCRAKKVLNL